MSIGTVERRLQQLERLQPDRRHIFAVDGASGFRELIQTLFTADGFAVTTSRLAPGTFDRIVVVQPNLIIVDLVPGAMDCWELLEELHQESPTYDIPVILTSTSSKLLEQAQANAARYGNHRVMLKPLDLDSLIQTVLDTIRPA